MFVKVALELMILFTVANCDKITIKKSSMVNITNGQNYLQMKNVKTLTKKLIKRVQTQNDKTNENLNDCYLKFYSSIQKFVKQMAKWYHTFYFYFSFNYILHNKNKNEKRVEIYKYNRLFIMK